MDAQHAVDSIPNLQAAFARFDVNVTRLLLQRFEQQLIHQPNDGGLLSHLGQFAVCARRLGEIVVVIVRLLLDEFVDCVATDAELFFDELHDVVVSRENRLQPQVAERTEFIECFKIERIARRDFDAAIFTTQWQE